MSNINAEAAVSVSHFYHCSLVFLLPTVPEYAALILADAEVSITPEKLQTLLKAAGIEDVEPIWATLFSKALKDKNVKEILTTVTTAGPAKGPGGDATDKGKQHGGNDGAGDEAGTDVKEGDDGSGEESDEDLGNLFDL
jgi:large subunit ribosomal protein LP1